MALSPPLAFTGCDKLAPGVHYVVQATAPGSIALGVNISAMTLVSMNAGERLFLRGPGFVKQLGSTTLQPMDLLFSCDGPLSSGVAGGGHEPPILGE